MKLFFISTVAFETHCETDEDAKNACDRADDEIIADGPGHNRKVVND